MENQIKIPTIRRITHELKNAGGDGSAKSIALGVFVLTTLCSAALGGYIWLASNPQILGNLGIR